LSHSLPEHAIVLAAGVGKRLGSAAGDAPKGLIEVGGETLVDASLRKLRGAGVRRALIVTGHRAAAYEEVSRRWPDMVELVNNSDFATSGSLGSLRVGAQQLRDEAFVLESDIIYESRALHALTWTDSVLVSGPTGLGDEVHVWADGSRMVAASKHREERVNESLGEWVGISRLSAASLAAVGAGSTVGLPDFGDYEDAIVAISQRSAMSCVLVSDLVWGEIDDPHQLEVVRRTVVPEVHRRDDVT